MEISPQLMLQLQQVFKVELAEHLETITNGLLALERGMNAAQQQELLENMFRAAHNLKGAARGVSEHSIADITHRLESIFNLLKKGQLKCSADLVNTALQAVDNIKKLSENPNINPQAFKTFLDRLDNCLTGDVKSAKENPVEPVKPQTPKPAPAKGDEKPREAVEKTSVPAFTSTAKKSVKEPAILSTEAPAQSSYNVLSKDVKQLAVITDEVQTSRLQLKKHLLDFQQFCQHLEHLSGRLNESVSNQAGGRYDEKMLQSLSELSQLSSAALNSYNNLRQINTHLHQTSQSLSSAVNTMRLVPFSLLLAPLHRIVRDLSQQQQKKIQFVIVGEEIKIDRNLYKVLHAPLVHLISNAIDHGIELPQQRQAEGKLEQGLLRIKISKVAANIVISLSDDGIGIDLDALRQKIVRMQWMTAGEAKLLTDEAALDFIFKPGFSLAPILTEVSGRGIGLDAVKTNLRKIKGTVSVNTALNHGTEFTLTLPAALTSESGILIEVNQKKFALQGYNVDHVLDVASENLIFLNGKNLLPTSNGQPLSVYYLPQLLGIDTHTPTQKSVLATVLITDGEQKIALIVDSIIGEQDLIIKPFSYPLLTVPFAVGMAILGSGELVPVLHASDLIAAAFVNQQTVQTESMVAETTTQRKILVIDDSTTSRALEKNILEQHGFFVMALVNGLQAWQELQRNPHYDLIVTDIEMPLMDGFELVEKIKNTPETRNIPTVIVSSLNSEQDKRRGVQVGADAYVTKDAFDSQQLLNIINQLI